MVARTHLAAMLYVHCLYIRSVLTSTNQTLGSCVRALLGVNISLVPSVSVVRCQQYPNEWPVAHTRTSVKYL